MGRWFDPAGTLLLARLSDRPSERRAVRRTPHVSPEEVAQRENDPNRHGARGLSRAAP